MFLNYIMGTHMLSPFVLGIFLLILLLSHFTMTDRSHFKMRGAKVEKLYDENTLEMQNVNSSVKAKKQRGLLVEPKNFGGPIVA